MSTQCILGLVLLVVGGVLLVFGLNATDSVADEISEGLTGKFTDETTWYILGGLALALVGGLTLFVGSGRARSA